MFIVLLVALLISPIAKNYIEKHSKELTGRVITMDKLRINIFAGSVRIENFVMRESNETASFISFDRFETAVRLWPMLNNKFIIKRILLSGADIKVYQKGDRFNFDSLIDHFASDSTSTVEEADTTKGKPWEIGLYNIEIANSKLLYKDMAINALWQMNDLDLKIPGVYFSNQSTDVGINLNFMDGGSLHTDLKYDIASNLYKVTLSLKNFSLEDLLPYLQQSMDVGKIAGIISVDVNVSGNMDRIAELDVDISGALSGHAIHMTDGENRKIVAVDTLYTRLDSLNPAKELYKFGKIYVGGVSGGFEIYENGENNFTYLMKEDTTRIEEEPAVDTIIEKPESNASFFVGEMLLEGASFTFSDHSLVKPFEYRIEDIMLHTVDFNPEAKNSVVVSATLDKVGKANVKWNGQASDMANQNLTLTLRNVDLKTFTPYSLQYFGYPLSDGVLTFTSQNVVDKNMLNGINKLDAYKLNVGNKDKTVQSEYNLPLKLGLYVLKDKQEKINLDLPVKGNISSPEFSYKKVIINALMNVLVKVATAPVSFLANQLGFKGDDLQYIVIEPLSREFNSEQYKKFDELAQVLKMKPELQLILEQEINYNSTLENYALMRLKGNYYLATNPNKAGTSLDMLDFNTIMNIDTKSEALSVFADTLLLRKGITPEGNIHSKAITLFSDTAEEFINRTAESRNTLLKNHMIGKLGLADSTFIIRTMPLDGMKQHKDPSRFAVTMEFAGEISESE